MRLWKRFRAFVARLNKITWMKPERIQRKRLPPFDVPMTAERIQVRAAGLSENWSLVLAPVAIRYWKSFESFQAAADFVSREVGRIAEATGEVPFVRIDGNDVFMVLGLAEPKILTEGDFDFGVAIDEAGSEDDPEGSGPGEGDASGDEPGGVVGPEPRPSRKG